MNTIFKAAVAVGVALCVATSAAAEWKPDGPIKMLIAFTAGGGADTQARLIVEELETRHGWNIIPEQVTGRSGGNLAVELAKAPADGLTVGMVVTATYNYNQMVNPDPGYGPEDMTPLTIVTGTQMGVVARADRGWNTLEDVIAAARAGETISFGAQAARLEDAAFLIGEHFDVSFNIVGFDGGRGVLNAVNAGDVDLGWVAGAQTRGVVAGDLVNVASGERDRLRVSPDAPTLLELGMDYTFGADFMLVAPPDLSTEIRTALAARIGEIIMDPESKTNAFVTRAFGGPRALDGEALDTYLEEDRAQAQRLIDETS